MGEHVLVSLHPRVPPDSERMPAAIEHDVPVASRWHVEPDWRTGCVTTVAAVVEPAVHPLVVQAVDDANVHRVTLDRDDDGVALVELAEVGVEVLHGGPTFVKLVRWMRRVADIHRGVLDGDHPPAPLLAALGCALGQR